MLVHTGPCCITSVTVKVHVVLVGFFVSLRFHVYIYVLICVYKIGGYIH